MLGMTWLALWLLVGREIPHRETVIPLTNDRGSGGGAGGGGGSGAAGVKGRPAATPWKRMMASPAVWAIVINNFSFHYAFYVIMNWMPTYFTRLETLTEASIWELGTTDLPSGLANAVLTHFSLPFLPSVLKVDLASLGTMKTLPYIVMFLMSNVGGLVGDWLIMQRGMSVGAGRKAVNTIGEGEGQGSSR